MIVNTDVIAKGSEYAIIPGKTQYELSPGLVVTLKRDSYQLIKELDLLEKEDDELIEFTMKKAKMIVQEEVQEEQWQNVSVSVVMVMVTDFFTAVLRPLRKPIST